MAKMNSCDRHFRDERDLAAMMQSVEAYLGGKIDQDELRASYEALAKRRAAEDGQQQLP